MRISIVLILCFCFHFTALLAEEMTVRVLPNFKAEPRSASVEKISVLSKKQCQAVDLEAFSTHIDRIHLMGQADHSTAMINPNVNNGYTEISRLKTVLLANFKPYIYGARLEYLYPKHTFW